MIKKLLIIAATHGDEKIGVEVVEILQKKGYKKRFDYLIANPRAFKKNIRFIEADLSRSYPGEKNSPFYEKRKAYKNLELAKKYKYIIDIHETDGGASDFIIIPKEKITKLFPLQFINLEKVVLWPDPKGPLSQILDNAIELEFTMKNKSRGEVVKGAVRIIEEFLDRIELVGCDGNLNCDISDREIYYVYSKLLAKDKLAIHSNLKDFKKARIGNEEFYPLLVGQYLGEGIACYKMRRIR